MSAVVYLNGRLIPAAEASLPLFDAGLVQGATLTVQTRTFRKRLFRLEARVDALLASLDYAGWKIDLPRAKLVRLAREVLGHNAPLAGENAELGLIHFVTAGEYSTYAAALAGRPARREPTVCIHTFPLPFPLWAGKMIAGAHLVIPSVRHVPPECWSPHVKCRSRMHWVLADQEARAVDPEASALLLDLRGFLTETNTGNLFLVSQGRLLSPTTRNILPGHSRAFVLELACRLGIPFAECDLTPADARTAEEAFLTSTPYCIMPVARIDGQRLGDVVPGPMTRRLQQAWSEAVGVDFVRQIVEGATPEGGACAP